MTNVGPRETGSGGLGNRDDKICKSARNRNGGLTTDQWLHREPLFQGMLYLCNFTKSSSFLSEIDDNSTPTLLCLFNCLLDTKNKIWATSTNIRSEHVTSVTLSIGSDKVSQDTSDERAYLIMNSQSQSNTFIRHFCWVSKAIYRETTFNSLDQLTRLTTINKTERRSTPSGKGSCINGADTYLLVVERA